MTTANGSERRFDALSVLIDNWSAELLATWA